MDRDRWLVALAASALATSVAGLLVPLYIVGLGGGAAQLGLSAALSSLVGAPGAVLAGRYADRTGDRRAVVMVALVVGAIALGALPLLESIPLVIVTNAALAFSVAAVGPVVTMLVVGDAPEAQWPTRIARGNQLQGYGGTLGFVVGTVWIVGVGRLLDPALTQGTLFVVAAAFGVASAVAASQWLPRRATVDVGPRRSDRVAALLSETSWSVREVTVSSGLSRFFWAVESLSRFRPRTLLDRLPRALVVYFGGAFVFFTGFAIFWAPLPLYLTRAGFSGGEIFAIYLVNNVGSTVLYGAAGRLASERDVGLLQGGALGVRAVSFLGVGVLGVVGAGFFATGGVAPLAVVAAFLLLVGATWAFIAVTGTAIVSRLSPARTRGGVLGIYAALSALAGAFGSIAGGWIASRAFDLAFVVSVTLVLAGAAIVVVARHGLRPAQP